MSATPKIASSMLLLGLAGALTLAPLSRPARACPEHGEPWSASCMKCHEELEPVLARPVPHPPAQEEECALCHSPHASKFDHLLNMRERALCTACHRDEVLGFQNGHVHTPVQQGRCTACHDPHGAEHEGLLVMESNDLCLSCHEYQRSQVDLATVHQPFADGSCTDCHDPHNAEFENQLVAPAKGLCLLCHDAEDPELIEAHYEIPVEGTDCVRCHDPHGSVDSGLLLPVTHDPFSTGSCDLCHMVESETPRLVRTTGVRLCVACHEDFPPEAKLVHAPVAEGDCAACHSPHASRHRKLLPAAMEATCRSCHVELEERAKASRSVHPVKFEGGESCDACHLPHASDQSWLLKAGPIRTCLSCHASERHGHPLGDDLEDPRSGLPITCVTCHDPHGTEFAYQLIGERTRGLCLECHDSDSEGGVGARR